MHMHTPREISIREEGGCPHTVPRHSLPLCLGTTEPPQPCTRTTLRQTRAAPGSCPTGRSTGKTTACRLSTRPLANTHLFWGIESSGGREVLRPNYRVLLNPSVLHKTEPLSPSFRSLTPAPGLRCTFWTFISK